MTREELFADLKVALDSGDADLAAVIDGKISALGAPKEPMFSRKALSEVVGMLPRDIRALMANVVAAPTNVLAGIHDFGTSAISKAAKGVGLDIGPATQVSPRFNAARDLLAGRSQVNDPTPALVQGLVTAPIAGASVLRNVLQGTGIAASESGADPFSSGIVGGMLGGGITAGSNLLGKIFRPIGVEPELRSLHKMAKREGIPLELGQALDNKAVQLMESKAQREIPSSGVVKKFRAEQQNAFNRAVLRKIGYEADNITPQMLNKMQKQIGEEIDRALPKNTVIDLTPAMSRTSKVLEDQIGMLRDAPGLEDVSKVSAVARRISAEGGVATAEQIKTMRRTLSDLATSAFKSEKPALGQAYEELVRAIDDSIADAVPASQKAAWDAARKQYAKFKVIDVAMDKPSIETAVGNIKPQAFAQSVRETMPVGGYGRGRSDFADLARIGQHMRGTTSLQEGGIGGVANPINWFLRAAYPRMQSTQFVSRMVEGSAVDPVDAAIRKALVQSGLLSGTVGLMQE